MYARTIDGRKKVYASASALTPILGAPITSRWGPEVTVCVYRDRDGFLMVRGRDGTTFISATLGAGQWARKKWIQIKRAAGVVE